MLLVVDSLDFSKASVAAFFHVLQERPAFDQQRLKLDSEHEDENEHDSGSPEVRNFTSLPLPGIQRIAETISQEVQGEKRERHRDHRENQQPPVPFDRIDDLAQRR